MSKGDVNALRPVGRPRDLNRELALLEAAAEVLTEVGYDRLTMGEVAARAKASKATIYRRWPNKASLVVETIRNLEEQVTRWPDTGSLRGDPLAVLSEMAGAVRGSFGRIVTGTLPAIPHDVELAGAVREVLVSRFRDGVNALLRRAEKRAEVAPHADTRLVFEVPLALLLFRFLVADGPFDDDYVEFIVDDVVLPLLIPA